MDQADGDATLVTPPVGQPPPIIITEAEVVFATAAAMRPMNYRWWSKATRVVVHSARRFVRSTPGRRLPRQDQPSRYEFPERSCMGRETDRL